ncbi:type II secretion system F family protein [Phenylobacterium terrae]|uniref:Type II secretion system F family protein n=1 Tax=Phenylobacterium terrae TaxID=2665495 RepID=A0ABW4N1U4_9CAUL
MPNFQLDANAVFLVLVFAAVFAAAQAGIGLVRVASVKRKVNKRLVLAERIGGISELVLELRKQRGLSANGEKKGWAWLSDLIVRSGLTYEPRRWALLAVGAGAIAALGAFVATKNLALAAVAPLPVVTLGPIVVLKVVAGKRAKALGFQLPQALDIIVRSLEAGHPVPTAIALVGREMSDPIGTEFGMAADEISYGATLQEAVDRIAERCQHPDVDLFAATVRLQERAGGNLTGLLKLNAHTVRERHKMRLKIKAASSEGRASAMILTSAPFLVAAMLQLISPGFYGDVIHEPFIQIGLAGLGLWMFIGNLVMQRMIDMRI